MIILEKSLRMGVDINPEEGRMRLSAVNVKHFQADVL
jgi:hypothetical protein